MQATIRAVYLATVSTMLLMTGCATSRNAKLVAQACEAAARPAPLPPLDSALRDLPANPNQPGTRPRTIVNPDGTRVYPLQSAVGRYIDSLEVSDATCRARHSAVVQVYDRAERLSRAIPPG